MPVFSSLKTIEWKRFNTFLKSLIGFYSLMPTEGAPTMLISGIPMHRIKNTDPWRDTEEKIRAAGPIGVSVLDTATGLGYTASATAKMADCVTTIELTGSSCARHLPRQSLVTGTL